MIAFLLFIVNTFVILVVGCSYLPCIVIWDRNWHKAIYFKLALCSDKRRFTGSSIFQTFST
jgi:hypothetical protein